MKERIREIFFKDTLRRWHFTKIMQETKMSRERTNHFLKELLKEGTIIRIKPKGKMPYYIAKRQTQKFRGEKQLYGLKMLQESGLFEHIRNCKNIQTAIIFGSFAKGNWNNSSDIDLFIFGDDSEFEKGKFEKKLKREIQICSYKNKAKLKKELDQNLIPNIIKGFHIKTSNEPFEVKINA